MCFYVKFLGLHGVTLDNNYIIIHTLYIIIFVAAVCMVAKISVQLFCHIITHAAGCGVVYKSSS
jgi:hypothetical protein